jgi:FkbM family methyltransferase
MGIRTLVKNGVLRLSDDGRGGFRILWGPLRGRRLVLGQDDRKLYLLGLYERKIADVLRRECPPGGAAVDLGAHIGYFTLLLASLTGSQGKVYSLEPNPSNAAKIRQMLALNGLGQVELFEAAVSDQQGTMQFEVEDTGSMGRLLPSGRPTSSSVEVRVETLDALAAAHDFRPIGLIKMDIEGAEAGALLGMKGLLERCRPVIICEWHPARAACGYREAFQGVGYRCELLEPESASDAFHLIARPA